MVAMSDRVPNTEAPAHEPGGELASFGEDLRREREIRGISIKEIADATKISGRFLDAIERNDHKTLPAPVFTRGFVREYARYVGLNPEEMVNRYNYAAANDDRIEKPPAIERYPETPVRDITPRPPRKRGLPSPVARIDWNTIVVLLLIAALGAVAWWAVGQKRFRQQFGAERPAAPLTTRAATPPAAASAAPAPATDDSTLRLELEATEDVWVELEADGEQVLYTTLAMGERRRFEASESFRFRTIGNAAGLNLTFNGTPVPALGGAGERVRNRTFDRESLQALRAEADAAPRTES